MKNLHVELLDAAVERRGAAYGELKGAQIFVTGASGFLAANLLVYLSSVSRRHGLGLRLAASARRPPTDVPLFGFVGGIPTGEWTQTAVEETKLPDGDWIVVHAASFGSPRDYLREPLATHSANVLGIVRLLEQHDRIRHLIFVSSAEIYGQPPAAAIPTSEDFVGGPPTLAERSVYAESKRMAETLGSCLAEQAAVPFTVLRPWNVYGPGQRLDDGRVPMEFVRQARERRRIELASDGSPTRTFCYVWDAVRQIASTLGRTEARTAFNIGSAACELSILEVARTVADACGLPVSAVAYDSSARVDALQRCAPDLRRVLELRPSEADFIPIEMGVRALIEWHRHCSDHA